MIYKNSHFNNLKIKNFFIQLLFFFILKEMDEFQLHNELSALCLSFIILKLFTFIKFHFFKFNIIFIIYVIYN